MKIENRTFIVSGGSSGLGLATVDELLSQNAYIAVLDLAPLPSYLSSDSRVKYIKLDITSTSEIESAVQAVVSWTKETNALLGGVINCAGVGVAAKFVNDGEPHDLELWEWALKVNLTGTFDLTRRVVSELVKVAPQEGEDAERGVIIMVSSAAAYEGQPGQTAYSATKGALRSMTLPMARDLARHHIRVVSIAPGVFSSNMTDRMPDKVKTNLINVGTMYPKRFGKGPEFAHTVKWVLENPFVNGETIRLSGAGRLPGKL